MSKFIDKLKLVSGASSPPMGFRTAATPPPQPRMLLVAALAEPNIEGLADYVSGADAGLVPIHRLSSGAKAVNKISRAMPAIPWGGRLKGASGEKVKPPVEAGGDFVIFPWDTPLAILQDSKIGKIMEIGAPLDGGLLKTIDDLPVDAVLASEPEKASLLTWRHLMFSQRCAELVTKPLLASVPASIGSNELQALWAAGVVAVVVETPPQGRISELRQIIDKLTFPPPSKRKKGALLPRLAEEKEE
jgi:hypothetical protein